MAEHAGSTNTFAVLDHTYVKGELDRILGNQFYRLRENLAVGGSVNLIGSKIVIDGHKPQEARHERAYVSISLYDGQVTAGINSDGHTTIYGDKIDYQNLDFDMKVWIRDGQILEIVRKAPNRDFSIVKATPRR